MVDSCVYLDILTGDSHWHDWSTATIEEFLDDDYVVMNSVIYSEISVSFDSVEHLESVLPQEVIDYRPIPKEAAFLAGKCYKLYRSRGGVRTSPLPDFFIGAHASVAGLPLVTRDVRRFREYFPGLEIVAP